jgi:hypothetical protein
MDFNSIVGIILLVGLGIWWVLNTREKQRAAQGLSSFPGWRTLLAALVALVLLFSGGCTLLILPDALRGTQYVDLTAVAVIGGIPFMISAFLLWLILHRRTSK